uniref:non-specific serine/threonine protein kinase n=1 Tax=Aegilops tauschii subsp. strangulata TaxID=200361 RepID=A0A453L0U2_AEGTS
STLAPAEVTASMLAVAGGSAICGVAADNGTAYCIAAGAGSSAYNASASSVAPQLVFSQVSGGTGFLCGVGAVPGGGVTALFCWPPAAPRQLRRVYRGPAPLSDLAVGADHVAAYDGQARGIRWWRRGSGQFPELVPGAFGSLVSGDGFTCALETGSLVVRCWGPLGSAVQAAFANVSVSSLAAGGSRACGVKAGRVASSGGNSPAP